MRKFLLLSTLLVAGCTPSAREMTADFTVMPEGLKDCKIYRLTPQGGMGSINVVRCPLSSTTTMYSSGKTRHNTTVVEADAKSEALQPEVEIDAVIINGQQFKVKK